MSDWNVEVKFKANTEDLQNDIKSSIDKTASDLNKELADNAGNVDTSKFTERMKGAINDLRGETLSTEMFIDTVKAESQFLGFKDLIGMSMREIQGALSTMDVNALQSSMAVLREGIRGNEQEVSELKSRLQSLNGQSLIDAQNQIKGLNRESQDARDKVKLLDSQLKQLNATSGGTGSGLGKITSMSQQASNSMMSLGSRTMGTAMSFGRMAFGLMGVQSMYAMLAKSMNMYIQNSPAVQSQTEGIYQAMGQLLAPVLGVVINAFQTLVRWVMIAIAYITTFINVIFGTNIAIRLTLSAIEKTDKRLGKLGKKAKKTGKDMKDALKGSIQGFDDLNVLTEETDDNLSGLDSDALGGLGDIGGVAPDMSAYDISEYLAPLQEFQKWLEKHRDTIRVILGIVLALVVAFVAIKVAIGIFNAVSAVVAIFTSTIGLVVLAVVAVIAIIYLLWTNWDTVVEWLRIAWEFTWNAIKAFVQVIVDIIIAIWNGFMAVLGAVLQVFVDTFKIAWNFLVSIVEIVVFAIQGIWNVFINVLKALIQGYVAIWQGVWNIVKAVFDTVIKFMQALWTKMWDVIVAIFETTTNVIKAGLQVLGDFFKMVWDGVLAVFQVVATTIGTVWNATVDGIKSVFQGVWNFLVSAIQSIGNTFGGVWDTIKNSFANAFYGIQNIFTSVWNWILGQFSKGGTIFAGLVDGVAGVFTSIVNTLIRGINNIIAIPFDSINWALNGIRNISVLGARPFAGLWGHSPVPVPRIPQLAKGSVVEARRGGTQVNIGEGIYDEAVVPLGQSPQMKELKSDIADEVVDRGGAGGGDTNVDLYIQLDESTLGRATIKSINKVQRDVGKVLINL